MLHKSVKSGLCLAVLAGLGLSLAQASPGSDSTIAQGVTTLPAGNGLDAFEKAFGDIRGLMNNYNPVGATISQKSYDANGPAGVPRVSFKATVTKLGIFHFSEFVRGDVTT